MPKDKLKSNIITTVDSVLYSYAQIFFSNRRWFGALILASSFINPLIGAMGLLGVLLSNGLALWLKFDIEKIRSGFYGFNGILFGCAAAYFFELSPFMILLTVIFIVIVFFISATLEHLMANVFNLPGLSLPFIITLYVFFIYTTNYGNIFFSGLHFDNGNLVDYVNYYLSGYFNALGLIVFQSNIIAGIIISLGLLFFSRVMFVNSIFAFVVNLLLLRLIFPQYTTDYFILTSFNSILTAFALGGSLILLSRKTFALITLSSTLVIVFAGFFSKLFSGQLLPVLVLPFNFIVLSTIYSLKFREHQSDFVLLYFKPGSPEENYYYHQNRKARFERFKYLLAELPFWGEWKISQGINGKITHKDDWKYAWDFVIEDDNGNEFENESKSVENYLCYSTPVVVPLDGEIVKVVDNIKDNEIGKTNLEENWGNSILIDHGEGLFSQLSHLKRGSIKVEEGDKVKKGEVLAQCGNSGRSPLPHLHFQFQLTDRIGDKTYEFPFAYYLVKQDDKLILKSFDYPQEGEKVRNIEVHKKIKKAFNFQLGDEFEFNCNLNGKNFDEHWEVKVNIYNQMYLENDFGDKAYFYNKDKVFMMTDYIGKKKSALYYFYILTIRIPLGYYENLTWEDEIPVSLTLNNLSRYLSEFILMFDIQLNSELKYSYASRDNNDSDFGINVKLLNRGKRLFSFVNEEGNGILNIDNEGIIKEFSFEYKKDKFNSKIIRRG